MTDDVVGRLYRCLVDELERRGQPPDEPVRVADLYQDLVPYAVVRSALGVELNADYEDALLRLLAGEGGRVRMEPAEAREELQRETRSPYPTVGLYRKFSQSTVWVERDAGSEAATGSHGDAEAAPGAEAEPDPASPPDAEPAPGPASAPAAEHGEPVESVWAGEEDGEGAGADEPAAEPDAVCRRCGEALPAGVDVRFCPYCGVDQRLRPCPHCETPLEPGWRYCVACGAEVGG